MAFLLFPQCPFMVFFILLEIPLFPLKVEYTKPGVTVTTLYSTQLDSLPYHFLLLQEIAWHQRMATSWLLSNRFAPDQQHCVIGGPSTWLTVAGKAA